MAQHYDVIVVGVGTMGSSACYHLAKRGAAVLGIDQFDVPNRLGAHHGHSRMIRLAYYEHPDYVPLLWRAYELWDRLEQESNRRVFFKTGGLYVGRAADPFVAGSIESAQEHGLPHEVLSRAAIAERYPQFHLPDDFIGLYEPDAGVLVPERVVEINVELAKRHGAEIHANEPVQQFAEGRVVTQRGEYTADRIIVTTGAWASLDEALRPHLTVTRQVMGWVEPKQPEVFTAERFPSFAISCDDGSAHYGFPIIPDVPDPLNERGKLFKISHHWHDRATTPDTINREPEPTDEDDFRPALRTYLPGADGPLAAIKICTYTNTRDCHFIINRHPKHRNVIVGCGFSGHGFKFASAIGEVLSDLTLDGRTDLAVGFLRLRRFA